MKIKKWIIILIIAVPYFGFSQDGNEWLFEFKFKLDTKIIGNNFKNLEVYFNESKSFENYRSSSIQFDSLSKEYLVKITYNCISCGYENSDSPPDIYLKINMNDQLFTEIQFSAFIPVYFHKSNTWKNLDGQKLGEDRFINIGTINIQNFVTDNYWNDDGIEKFEIIEIINPNSKYYRKKDEYRPRRMNKMIKVESEK